jgi:hypothetical protein
MPKFYFDAEVGGVLVQDEDGQEFADRYAAGKEAMIALSEMARGLPGGGKDQNRIVAVVRDEAGKPVLTATLNLNVEWNE